MATVDWIWLIRLWHCFIEKAGCWKSGQGYESTIGSDSALDMQLHDADW